MQPRQTLCLQLRAHRSKFESINSKPCDRAWSRSVPAFVLMLGVCLRHAGIAQCAHAWHSTPMHGHSDVLGAGSQVAIVDPGHQRKVVIKSSGFQDTVVWNPWREKAAGMSDFGDNEWAQMLCIEPANAAMYLQGSSIEVAAGDTWTAQQSIHVEPLS